MTYHVAARKTRWKTTTLLVSLVVALAVTARAQSVRPGASIATQPADVAAALAPANPPAPDAQRLADLIDGLGSPDPAIRQSSLKQLVDIGAPARAALEAAAKPGEEPEIRAGAAEALMRLPWFLPTDSPEVRDALTNYGSLNESLRVHAVEQLFQLGEPGFTALCRIIRDEPSDEVRWQIAAMVLASESPAHEIALRAIDPPPDSAPMLAMSGVAWAERDPRRAQKSLQAALNVVQLTPHPVSDLERRLIYGPLVALDKQFHLYDDAAAALRAELRGSPMDPDISLELLELHGSYGPLRGYDQDLRLASTVVNTPMGLYSKARLLEREMQPDQARDLVEKAFAQDDADPKLRLTTGRNLADQQWDDWARRELEAFLKMPPDPLQNHPAAEFIAQFLLAQISHRDGDDSAAAAHEQACMNFPLSLQDRQEITPRTPCGTPVINDDSFNAEIQWLMIRAARKKNDTDQVDKHLAELLRLAPVTQDIAPDVVPLLREKGRGDEAQAFFDRIYKPIKSELDNDPDNPEIQNNLAWLCAECDQQLPQALAWAQSAVAARPETAAYIDTLAECNYRLGHRAQAVLLEAHALELQPHDSFMSTQLEKFRAAAATQPG
jgi:tetratricopeptide (TPR) repeat protein